MGPSEENVDLCLSEASFQFFPLSKLHRVVNKDWKQAEPFIKGSGDSIIDVFISHEDKEENILKTNRQI